MATTALLAILAMAVLPTAKATHRRSKELELRAALRELRDALEKYRMHADPAVPLPPDRKIEPREPFYPEKLEDLVEGKQKIGKLPGDKIKFLRKIPNDPLTGDADWGLRCYEDGPESTSWCGKNIYDVYSKSPDTALDGTKYRDW